jgi:predicted MPP superfamily phosphohydrolase
VAAGGLAGDAFEIEPRRVQVTRHVSRIPGLARALDGIRIAHITDVHLPANRPAAARTLELLRYERPEIVVLVGDMCETNNALAELTDFAEQARGSRATVATLGNWEYGGGIVGELARRTYAEAGIPLLINEHAVVTIGGDQLAFVGLDDMLAGEPNPGAAAAGVPAGVPAIWLCHEPVIADRIFGRSVARPATILAGHTHGGQIRLPGLPAFTPVGSGRYLEGWYDTPAAPMYVSRGIGTAEIRARFLCPPELPIFTLRSGNE